MTNDNTEDSWIYKFVQFKFHKNVPFFLLKSTKQKEKPDIFSGGDYSCLATVEGIELSKEELRGDLVPCGKSEKFRNNF